MCIRDRLKGTPVTNETWTVVLGGVSFSVRVGQTYGAVTANNLDNIAAALAVVINADSSAQAVNFVAAPEAADASSSKLIVVNRAGTPFTVTTSITSASNALIDSIGAVRIINIDADFVLNAGATATLVIISGGIATPVSYLAPSSKSAAAVASELAAAINSEPALANFTATVDGLQIIIVDRTGAAFSIGNF